MAHFHTITSILKLGDVLSLQQGEEKFPYDYVYFKAYTHGGSMQKVTDDFHTITSILKHMDVSPCGGAEGSISIRLRLF